MVRCTSSLLINPLTYSDLQLRFAGPWGLDYLNKSEKWNWTVVDAAITGSQSSESCNFENLHYYKMLHAKQSALLALCEAARTWTLNASLCQGWLPTPAWAAPFPGSLSWAVTWTISLLGSWLFAPLSLLALWGKPCWVGFCLLLRAVGILDLLWQEISQDWNFL